MNAYILRKLPSFLGALFLSTIPAYAMAQDPAVAEAPAAVEAPAADPAPAAPAYTSDAAKLADNGDFAGARKLAIADLRSGKTTDASEFWSYVERDPLMNQVLEEEVKPHGTNSLSALGGGSTVSFKYKDSADESMKAAIKPDQDLRQTMYRSGIAYYRMCQILECSFDTPITRPVKISKKDFDKLYDNSVAKNRGYKGKFVHLIWAKESGSDIMYGGFKEWIPDFDHFPIEASSAWSSYLKNPNANLPELDVFIKKVLEGGRENAVKKTYSKIMAYLEGMTTRDMLQQISDIILMDFLTNNWDRFSDTKTNYGANCDIQKGGLVAIDNDAAFPPWHSPRVVKRLHMVEMFSRNLVENLRVLDENVLLEHLFPNSPKSEKANLQRFRERRAEALKYIDGLIAKKGEDKVLVF